MATKPSTAKSSSNYQRRNQEPAQNPRRMRGPRRSKFITRREVHGGKIDVPTNPPEVAYQPWMPLIVVHSGISGDFHITVRDLCQQIARQIDPTQHALRTFGDKWSDAECIMQVRLRSVRAWNLTGRMISLSVDDFSDVSKAISDVDTLCGLVDTGSTMHVPAVGFQLPTSHQNIVLRNDKLNHGAILYHVMSSSNDNCIIYSSVFFRFDGPAKFSGFQDSMYKLVRNIGNKLNEVKNEAQQINKSVKEIQDHDRGSVVNAIYKGVSVLAPVVAPVVAGEDSDLTSKVDDLCQLIRGMNDDVSVISRSEVEE